MPVTQGINRMLLPFDESQETSNVEAERPKRTPLNPSRIRDH